MMPATASDAAWRTAPAVVAVLDALAVGAGSAATRFVGGAVRDCLARRPVADIDLATQLSPVETMRRLAAAGLKVVPTGLAHGTVTAISEGRPFEITALREDVATDGRHAVVAFTDDWRADAARRDFTINAMSMDPGGQVFDYFGGQDDLAAGRVRFVGAADQRVAEDYLRILRFFRFHAWYGRGAPDAGGLAAIARGRDGLHRISGERVRAEILRLLVAPDPGVVLEAMAATGTLQAAVGLGDGDIAALLVVETAAQAAPDPLLRLAALAAGLDADGRRGLAGRMRLSNDEAETLAALAPPWTTLGRTAADWRQALHRDGAECFRRRALLAASVGETEVLAPRLAAAAAWTPLAMPLSGGDIVALGVAPGPAVGTLLAELEAEWRASDFKLDRAALLARAGGRVENDR